MAYSLHEIYYDVLVLAACQYSALTWMSYDIILTFSQELDVVWRRGWSLGKVCYLLSRYYSFMTLLASAVAYSRIENWNATFCRKWFEFLASGSIIGPISVDMMLILRLYALYDKNKKLLVFLLVLWITEAVLMLEVSIYSLAEIQYFPVPSHLPIPNCWAGKTQNFVKASYSWIFTLAVQFIFFTLTLSKYIQSIANFGDFGNGKSLLQVVRQTKNYAPLVTLFIRDGTFAFLAYVPHLRYTRMCAHILTVTALQSIFAGVFLSLLFFAFLGHTVLGLMGTPWMLAIVAVAASRLYLSLGGYLHHVNDMPEDLDVYLDNSGTDNSERRSAIETIPERRRRIFTRDDSSLEHIPRVTSVSLSDYNDHVA